MLPPTPEKTKHIKRIVQQNVREKLKSNLFRYYFKNKSDRLTSDHVTYF